MFKKLFELLSEEDLLHQALRDASTMLGLARDVFEKATAPCFEGRQVDAGEVYRTDEGINELVMEVRRKVFEHVSLMPRQDTTSALVLTIITVDIERIGDYSKNCFELWRYYPQVVGREPPFRELRDVYGSVGGLFERTAKAFEMGDAEMGRGVMEEHSKNAAVCEEIVGSIIRGDERWCGLSGRESARAVLMARYLKRVSSHLKNIASSVVNPFDRISFKPESR